MRQLWWSALIAFVAVGCGGERANSDHFSANGETAGSERAPASATEADASALDEGSGQEAVPPGAGAAVAQIERKIIYVADVSLVVEDFAQTEEELPELVKQFDGYLAETTVDRTHGEYRSGRWTARIPVAKYDAFLEALERLGVPERLHQTAQDVTEEFVDLQARIANKKRLEERILKLLDDRSGNIKDVIEVERELARVRSEIEQMEGRLRYLKNRTSLTTVTINAREERDYVPPQAPTFAVRISQAWTNSLLSLRQAGEWATITLVAAAPWLVFIVPVVWFIGRCCKRRRKAAAANPDASTK